MNRAAILQEADALEAAAGRLRALAANDDGAQAAPAVAIPAAAPALAIASSFDLAKFFDGARGQLWPRLSVPQVDGCKAILLACAGWPVSWTAYAMATAYHETAYTMQPVRERGNGDKDGDGEDDYFEKYDVGPLAAALGNTPGHDGDGGRYCGRGYPQLTGLSNYRKATAKLKAAGIDVDLEAQPELALRPDVAAYVMRSGMEEGWFTGKSLNSYLPAVADIHQFTNARRIINGQDRAVDIAGYALKFQGALQLGGWS